MHHFIQLTKAQCNTLIRTRDGETKLGEIVELPQNEPLPTFLKSAEARYVLFGIAEDIGVLANYGNAGTALAWQSFLTAFLNIQANDFTRASVAVIGHFSFNGLVNGIEGNSILDESNIQNYRKAVTVIDSEVALLVQWIVSNNKIPIVIGGGHNNSYPIIKGTSCAFNSTINCINVDAHIDYRRAEGRHSGNGFRYAKQEGFLRKYFALALHENYIPQTVLEEIVNDDFIDFNTYESIAIRKETHWLQALEGAVQFVRDNSPVGIELDLDSVEGISASALSPSGISVAEARQYVSVVASTCRVAYLHICEGIPDSLTGRALGKLIVFLVTDFLKATGRNK